MEFLTPGEGASPAVPAAQVSHSTHGAHSMHGVESAHSSLTSSLQPALASLGIEPLTQRPASLLNAQSHAPHAAHAGPGSHILAASGESLFLWDLEEGVLQQQADAPGTSGSTVPAGGCRYSAFDGKSALRGTTKGKQLCVSRNARQMLIYDSYRLHLVRTWMIAKFRFQCLACVTCTDDRNEVSHNTLRPTLQMPSPMGTATLTSLLPAASRRAGLLVACC